jgi:hypothetical protein
MSLIAKTPTPPYYAVIFSSHKTDDTEGYAETAARMVELAARPGNYRFLLGRSRIDQPMETKCRASPGAEIGHEQVVFKL